jgi:acetyl-CoA acetyltransferase
MGKTLQDLRPVYVVGIGLHPYQKMSATPYVALGLTAIREALNDAKLGWPSVEAAYHGTALLGMAPTRTMLRHLGASGIPMMQIENASASGSTAFRQAVLDVASGVSDVALAVGVDKPAPVTLAATRNGIESLEGDRVAAFTHFALLSQVYASKHGVAAEDIAQVAVKNSRNGALNPNAQRREAKTLAEVMQGPPIAGALTPLQCCPIGEGAAAVIVASEAAIAQHGLDRSRAMRVVSSVLRSERANEDAISFDAVLTRETMDQMYAETGLKPGDLDVIELHDAFAVEEIFYLEAMGICGSGEAPRWLKDGAFDIGGQVAVSPSGGLLAMGHPIGPTGVGQIAEVARQLRGEAGARQHKNARRGLAHMVGVGAVCAVHVLARD